MALEALAEPWRGRLIRRRLRLLATVSILALLLPILTSFFGIHRAFVIVSESMAPTLKPGDILLTVPVEGVVENGTIIVFKSPLGGFEAHRVVGCVRMERGVYYVTRGDANDQEDSFLVSERSVLGALSLVIPGIGFYFLIPREVALVSTLALMVAYVLLTFRAPYPGEGGARVQVERRRRVKTPCLLLVATLISGFLGAQSSLRLVYPTSLKGVSVASPPLTLQQWIVEAPRYRMGQQGYGYCLRLRWEPSMVGWLLRLQAQDNRQEQRGLYPQRRLLREVDDGYEFLGRGW